MIEEIDQQSQLDAHRFQAIQQQGFCVVGLVYSRAMFNGALGSALGYG
ncbi:MAG: hypothetical protein N838_21625 [Thiohalocapsa sp. PB-PSB1]|jgi:hypothetical protein|nr:MAG: hypothetical protein N838_21625 [Thiohalocapsa sp. PB-PSB1]